MKKILISMGVITLLATTGCIVPEGDRHEHARYEERPAVMVPAPEVVVRPPEVIVR